MRARPRSPNGPARSCSPSRATTPTPSSSGSSSSARPRPNRARPVRRAQNGGMDVEIRPITPEELPAYARVVETAFGIQPDDEILDLYRDVTEIDRTLAALAAGRIVATAGALSFELTLPWRETVAAAGITSVGVLPTYRRR